MVIIIILTVKSLSFLWYIGQLEEGKNPRLIIHQTLSIFSSICPQMINQIALKIAYAKLTNDSKEFLHIGLVESSIEFSFCLRRPKLQATSKNIFFSD